MTREVSSIRALVAEIESIGEVADALFGAKVLGKPISTAVVARAEAAVRDGLVERLARELEQARSPATRNDVLQQIARLIAAFPNADRNDTIEFARLLVDDILDLAPSRYALDTGL